MKYVYAIILFLSFNCVFAQLSVQNNAYVYVTDEVIFVEDDVNIDDATSHIYLRNEAQLIQGDPTVPTGNSGVGRLSVYQYGTVNTYAYNYWCSPVGFVAEADDSAPLDNNVNNYFKANANIYDRTGLITSNISGFDTSGYNGSTSPLVIADYWIWAYDPGTLYSEWDHVQSTGTVDSGYGFTMKGNPSGNQLYDFRGKPNNGTITVNVLNGEQTLVGNPYPSAIDALAFIHDTQNSGLLDVPDNGVPPGMSGALYYWEQAPGASSHVLTNYVGGYATYTISSLASGAVDSFISAPFSTYNADGSDNVVGNAGVDGLKTAYRYIPIGQGFMIEGTANTSIYFKNSHRAFHKESSGNSYFFRENNNSTFNSSEVYSDTVYNELGYNIIPNDFKRFRINVDFANNNGFTRQLLMNFHPTATDGFDYGLEAKTSEQIDTDAYWTLDGSPFVIQAFNFDLELKIPLVVNVNMDQEIRFRILDVQNFDTSQPIYLHDMETDVYVDLRNQEYTINLPQGEYESRFEITFTDETLSNETYDSDVFEIFQNNSKSELTILNPNGININRIALYDITGRQIFSHLNLGNRNEYHFTTKNLSTGVYVALVETDNHSAISKKVVVEN